jgi:hypothetical protein
MTEWRYEKCTVLNRLLASKNIRDITAKYAEINFGKMSSTQCFPFR